MGKKKLQVLAVVRCECVKGSKKVRACRTGVGKLKLLAGRGAETDEQDEWASPGDCLATDIPPVFT